MLKLSVTGSVLQERDSWWVNSWYVGDTAALPAVLKTSVMGRQGPHVGEVLYGKSECIAGNEERAEELQYPRASKEL